MDEDWIDDDDIDRFEEPAAKRARYGEYDASALECGDDELALEEYATSLPADCEPPESAASTMDESLRELGSVDAIMNCDVLQVCALPPAAAPCPCLHPLTSAAAHTGGGEG